MDANRFSVAIVGDQPVSVAGMERLINEDPALGLVACVPDVEQLSHAKHSPHDDPPDGHDAHPSGAFDVVVLDLPLGPPAGLPGMVSTAAQFGRPLVCSPWDQRLTLVEAIRAGAHGCLTRQTEQAAVRDALRTVARGGFYVCSRLAGQLQTELSRRHREDPHGLAPREIETLRWIALGFTHSQIATRMGLSQATINTYAKRIRAKLNVSNKAELTRMAIELGHLPQTRRAPVAA